MFKSNERWLRTVEDQKAETPQNPSRYRDIDPLNDTLNFDAC